MGYGTTESFHLVSHLSKANGRPLTCWPAWTMSLFILRQSKIICTVCAELLKAGLISNLGLTEAQCLD